MNMDKVEAAVRWMVRLGTENPNMSIFEMIYCMGKTPSGIAEMNVSLLTESEQTMAISMYKAQVNPGVEREVVPISPRFTQVAFDEDMVELQMLVLQAATAFENILDVLPAGRERSLAITHLEDVVIRANRAIAGK